ncbi:cytochrome c oxidase subunit 3 [Rhizobium sp. P28RR-XV]|uniref:cytochrome c oxidase subunit 3 n=1 Tax=Rhizobium sp. P28RR-XV TaxID=2726737 RepID=UPI0014568157|nr:cytochrome c oxidase subunit 3 [Rhizobium sp. P28RR-XV]NLR85636.1 hypothetical protein [Rhizobium sp. P28RR-XV]
MPDTEPVAEPFTDPRQQHRAAMMGMYVFLGSEIMLFGGLFCVAAAMRMAHSAEIVHASHALHFGIGGMNTAILLTSSLLVALGVESAKTGQAGSSARRFAGASMSGLAFLAPKAYEYRLEFAEGLLPVPGIEARYDTSIQHLFMNLYLSATALHAAHLTVGILLLLLLSFQTARGAIALPQRSIVLVVAGLYWHLVDVGLGLSLSGILFGR